MLRATSDAPSSLANCFHWSCFRLAALVSDGALLLAGGPNVRTRQRVRNNRVSQAVLWAADTEFFEQGKDFSEQGNNGLLYWLRSRLSVWRRGALLTLRVRLRASADQVYQRQVVFRVGGGLAEFNPPVPHPRPSLLCRTPLPASTDQLCQRYVVFRVCGGLGGVLFRVFQLATTLLFGGQGLIVRLAPESGCRE